MYIINPSFLSNTYKTKSNKVKNYLIKNNIPLLSQEDGIFYFSKNEKLKTILDNAPMWIKILY